jgi:polyhydroxybutyrate depolymerase
MKKKVNDVAFIRALIDKLIKEYAIDPKRVFVTGMSNGGMMTHRLGIELADKLAAIAPVVATVFGDEKPAAYPVSALMVNGMLDKSVPYQGGPPGGHFAGTWDGSPTRPALEQASYWAKSNNCTSSSDKQDQGAFIQWQYHCPSGKSVELYLIKDNAHAWPGGQSGSRWGDKPTTSLHATNLIWEFFKSHPK